MLNAKVGQNCSKTEKYFLELGSYMCFRRGSLSSRTTGRRRLLSSQGVSLPEVYCPRCTEGDPPPPPGEKFSKLMISSFFLEITFCIIIL